MSFFQKMLDLQLQLIFLIAVGMILNKTHVITKESRNGISELLLCIMLPASELSAFLGVNEVTPELMHNCLVIVVISAVTHILAVTLGGVIFKMYGSDERDIMHYGMIVPNTAFIGLPVIGALFGDTGLIYTSMYFIPAEIAMWTFGLALFKKNDNTNIIKAVLSAPAADAVFIGLFFMLTGLKLPEFMTKGIFGIGGCTTPLSMLVIGSILADGDYKKILSKPVFHFSAVRLFIFPIIIFIPMKLLGLDPLVIGTALILTCMPAAAATSILADKYEMNPEFAAHIVVMSTLVSIIAIPLMTLLL